MQNDNKPLWTRAGRDVGREEYDGFFKTTFKEFLEPMAVSPLQCGGHHRVQRHALRPPAWRPLSSP